MSFHEPSPDTRDGAVSQDHSEHYASPKVHLFPVLASTQVCLNLMAQQGALDLSAAANLLRRDPGAVLRTFRAVADEFPNPEARPERLEECIAALGRGRLQFALGTHSSEWENQARLALFARHSSDIARLCRLVARSLGLCEDRAYLVGLLHAVGTMPLNSGHLPQPDHDQAQATAIAVIRRHPLPLGLCMALEAVYRQRSDSPWVALVQAAHDLSELDPSNHCFLRIA